MRSFKPSVFVALFALLAVSAFAAACAKKEDADSASRAQKESVRATPEAADGSGATPSDGASAAVNSPEPESDPAEKASEGADSAMLKVATGADPAAKPANQDPAAKLAAPDPAGGRKLVAISASGDTRVIDLSVKELAETPEYKLRVKLPDGVKAGASGKIVFELTPKKGWKLNREFPTKLKVTAPEGVEIDNQTQTQKDASPNPDKDKDAFEKKGASWTLNFTPKSGGKKQFSGTFKFAVCTETTCDPKKEELAFAVEVQ